MTTQRARRDATRRRIIEAAGRLFDRQGVEATTVDQIAAAADVVKGTVYYNFGGKDDLVVAVAASAMGASLGALEQALAGPEPTDVILRQFLLEAADWVAANREVAAATYAISMRRTWAENEPNERPSFRQTIGRIVARGQQRGEIRADRDAYELGVHIASAYICQALVWLSDPSTPFGERIDFTVRLLFEGVRP